MTDKLLTKEKLFINTRELAPILYKSNGYADLDQNIVENNIEFDPEKTYAIGESNFFDFNQDLYEDINHMNSISAGIYCERSLITFRLFIWGSKGEGYEIFKHVLRGEEIEAIKNEEDLKAYIALHLNEFEEGILKTYNKDVKESYEDFGKAIETRQLPLQGILQFLTVKNNLKDFR